jgi:hypothetical protein
MYHQQVRDCERRDNDNDEKITNASMVGYDKKDNEEHSIEESMAVRMPSLPDDASVFTNADLSMANDSSSLQCENCVFGMECTSRSKFLFFQLLFFSAFSLRFSLLSNACFTSIAYRFSKHFCEWNFVIVGVLWLYPLHLYNE